MTTTTSSTSPTIADEVSYLQLAATLRDAAAAYYAGGDLLLDDASYDTLARAIADAEATHPEWVDGTPLSAQVAAGAGDAGDVAHLEAMLSLDNVFTPAELREWMASRSDTAGPHVSFAVEHKLDGASIAARYQDGTLVSVASRGDGTHGTDLRHAIDRLVGLPRELSVPLTCEVRGEVLFSRDGFTAANTARVASGKPAFVNARNAAAGCLRAENLGYDVSMLFFAHGVVGLSAEQARTHSDALTLLAEAGIATSPGRVGGLRSEMVVARIGQIEASRGALPYEIDGAVIKVEPVTAQSALGSSSRAPRWAIAYKYAAEEVTSTLLEVIWQVGKAGTITPRARIAPAFVGGTTVTYATLHNPTDIAAKGFLLGDQVIVKRAGEVIPRLEAPLVAQRTGNETPIALPEVCPQCSGPIDRSAVRWRCEQGRNCGVAASLRYAVSRDALDIEGVGEKLITQLLDAGLVTDLADLFTLTAEQLTGLDRMGATSAAAVIAQIDKARGQSFARLLTALAVRMTGRSMSRRLARHFGDIDTLLAASATQMEAVEGVGPERAATIRAELDDLAPLIARLRENGVAFTDTTAGADSNADSAEGGTGALPFAGMTVVVSGSVPGMTRTEANEAVERLGGRSSGSVSANTSLLVTAETTTSKAKKAADLGVRIMEPAEFATLVAGA